MRISDWSSDVCPSDLPVLSATLACPQHQCVMGLCCLVGIRGRATIRFVGRPVMARRLRAQSGLAPAMIRMERLVHGLLGDRTILRRFPVCQLRSEEHTSELQSLMRISYAVFCLKKQNNK